MAARGLDKHVGACKNEDMVTFHTGLAGLASLALIAGCAAESPRGERAERAPGPCATFPTPAASRAAALAYIEGLDPKPLRFLTAAGTDSALPDPAFAALQGKGPSYLYPPANPEATAKLRARLDGTGHWATMLVAWKGAHRTGDTAATIRMRGHYVVGEGVGTSAPARAIRFLCSAEGWKVSEVQEERAT